MKPNKYRTLLIDESPNGLTWAKKVLTIASKIGSPEFRAAASAAIISLEVVNGSNRRSDFQRQIDDLYAYCLSLPELIVGEVMAKIFKILAHSNQSQGPHFIMMGECLAICGQISKESVEGMSNDPIISREKCLELIESFPRTRAPHIELMKVTQELSDKNLVYVHDDISSIEGIESIGPRDFFFCELDGLFKEWNPSEDAIALIKMAGDSTELSVHEIDKKLTWTPRRINPAIAWLHREGFIENVHSLCNPYHYSVDWLEFNARAFLHVD